MEKLFTKLNENSAMMKNATELQINESEKILGIAFSQEYKSYLSSIGCVSYEGIEVYGLGVPKDYYLSLLDILPYLRETDNTFPPQAVPLSDIGDGHYYIYDNKAQKISVWATPNGGIVEEVSGTLENFLTNLLFN